MTFVDWVRCNVLFGYVAAKFADGNFRSALVDIVIGALLILAMRSFDPYVLGKH